MKILYVGAKYNYCNPARGCSFEHYNVHDTLVHMDNGAHSVLYFPFDEHLAALGKKAMNEKLIATVEKEKPTFCFFFLFTDELLPETIDHISKSGTTITFNWFADDHFRFDNFSKIYAPLFNWCSTTDPAAIKKYHAIGYKNIIKTQWGFNQFVYKKPEGNPTYTHDVSFIGQAHGSRRSIIQKLHKNGVSTTCFGKGWSLGHIAQEQLPEIFFKSKINLNLLDTYTLHILQRVEKIFIGRNSGKLQLLAPNTWFNNAKSAWALSRKQLKGRTFEIAGCGGFQLCEYLEDIEQYLRVGQEVVCYTSFEEMLDKIKFYLQHDTERARIAQAGYARTMKEHTYEARFKEIFKTIGV